jgi:hypothetical protein
MATYWIEYVEGASSGMPGGPQVFVAPIRRQLAVKAPSRADAYIQAYRRLAEEGRDVTALTRGNELPLGFTHDEAARIQAAGTSLSSGYPRNGFQIEQLVRSESSPDTDRPAVRLPDLPDVVLSSSEHEISGRWVIFYTWEEREPSTNTTFFVWDAEVSGLVGQAEEHAVREGHPFDLKEARRRAADSIVVRQIRPLLTEISQ